MVTCLRVRFEKGWGSSVASVRDLGQHTFTFSRRWGVEPPLKGNEGVVYAGVRAAIGFAADSCMEVRLRTMKRRKSNNEGIAREERKGK
jgi:hypothetical protein